MLASKSCLWFEKDGTCAAGVCPCPGTPGRRCDHRKRAEACYCFVNRAEPEVARSDYFFGPSGPIQKQKVYSYRMLSCGTGGCPEYGYPIWQSRDQKDDIFICGGCRQPLRNTGIIITTARVDLR